MILLFFTLSFFTILILFSVSGANLLLFGSSREVLNYWRGAFNQNGVLISFFSINIAM